MGGQLSFDVELVDVESGERLWTLERIIGPRERADSLVAALANAAATVAVNSLDPDAPLWIPYSTPPVSVTAYEAHLEQSAIFCQGDSRGSLEPGYRAVALSPDYVGAMRLLVAAHSNLGEDAVADSLIGELNGLRDRMTPFDRLQLDVMIGVRRGDPGLARRSAEEGYRIDPAGFGTPAMLTAYHQRRMEDAIERYRMGGDRYADVCPWPGHWLQGSIAFHTLGRLEGEMAVARDGLAHYPSHRGMMDIQIRVHAALGQVAQVDSLLDFMENLPPQAGWDPNLRGAYAALELIAHGYPEPGKRIMNETVADLSDSPPRNRARVYYWAGRFEEAATLFEDLIEAEPERVEYLWHYGASLARLGEEEEAREVIDRLGAVDPRNAGSPWDQRNGHHIWGQGLITAVLGDRDEAVRLFQEAFDQGRLFDIWVHREPALSGMWGYGPFDALMAPR